MTRLLTPLLLLALAAACNPDADEDGTKRKDDCDDENAAASPTLAEVCDGIDNDCDGEVDEDDATDAATWYADSDDDGYGDADTTVTACAQPDGYVSDDQDCDDSDDTLSPEGTEVCGGGDEDCDGTVDEDDASDALTWYADTDGDGLGDARSTSRSCDQPANTADNADDCDDTLALIGECCTEGGMDLIVTENASVEGGTYYLDRVSIPAGVTLVVTGTEPLVVFANTVDIAGTVDLSGQPGLDSGGGIIPNGGAAGPGGGGGGGGGDCGNGIGSGGAPNGATADSNGGRGGAPLGIELRSTSQGGGFGPGGGGGGGGHAVPGDNGGGFTEGGFGTGGPAYGTAFLNEGIYGGMGGAGGGANGGGGGGGGGVLIAHANQIDVSGVILARGGDGGGKRSGGCTSGGGGGGAGGAIWLQASVLDVSGTLDASGGNGRPVDSSVVLGQAGGNGSPGRVRVSSPGLEVTGTILSGSTNTDGLDPVCQ